MASKKTTKKDNKFDKEKMLVALKDKLKTSLQGLKEHFGEKKFEKRISKAAELLIQGKKKTLTKKVIVVKKKDAKAKSQG